MGPVVIKQGNQAAGAAYAPAQQAIQAQMPAIAQLYTTLLGALQGQVANQQQVTQQSAMTRGVGSAGLTEGIAGMLTGALGQSQAQLGVDTAGSRAALMSQLGQAGAARAQAGVGMAGQFQDASLAKQENQLALREMDRRFELDAIAERTRQAQAAARAAASGSALPKGFASAMKGALMQVAGPDGAVSPTDYKQAYAQWVSSGGDPDTFHSQFGSFVNRAHSQDYYVDDVQQQQAFAVARAAGGTAASQAKKLFGLR